MEAHGPGREFPARNGGLENFVDVPVPLVLPDAPHGFQHRPLFAFQHLHESTLAVDQHAGNALERVVADGGLQDGPEFILAQEMRCLAHIQQLNQHGRDFRRGTPEPVRDSLRRTEIMVGILGGQQDY